MNAALLMLSLSAGGHPAPDCCGAAPAAVAPCDGCGGAKPGLLDKLKGRLCHKPKAADCGGCDPCGGPPNLLDKLKARRTKHHHQPAADCGGCDPCATAPAAAPAPAAPADPPKDMPKPDAPKPTVPKELPKTGGNPGAVVVPPLPVTPVSGPKLNGADSPY